MSRIATWWKGMVARGSGSASTRRWPGRGPARRSPGRGSTGRCPGLGGRVAHVMLPVALGEVLVPAGADAHDVARLDSHPLALLGREHVGLGDLVGVGQRLDPLQSGDVKQHSAGDELDGHLGDVVLRGALEVVDRSRGNPVVEKAVVPDVGQAVPLGGGLQAHDDDVVGRDLPVLGVERVRGKQGEHVLRVVPPAAGRERAVLVERDAAVDDLAGPDQLSRTDQLLRGDEVERPDLVVIAPAAPVAELLAQFVMRPGVDVAV